MITLKHLERFILAKGKFFRPRDINLEVNEGDVSSWGRQRGILLHVLGCMITPDWEYTGDESVHQLKPKACYLRNERIDSFSGNITCSMT
jgi:hypothetical protein